MQDRRIHPRIPFATQVWVQHQWVGQSRFATADISDGGLFLEIPEHPFKGGEIIEVQACDMEDAPALAARVVRITEQGVGIAFLPEADDDASTAKVSGA
jgi:hypothetical protein